MTTRPRPDAAARFAHQTWENDGEDACHVWTGKNSPDGYPLFRVGGREVSAHRYAWETKYGPVPDGKFVKHSCRCRVCVRPDHLFLSDSPTLGSGIGKLSAADVIDMRRRHMAGEVTVPELVDEFGLSRNHVYLILNGKCWPHLWPYGDELMASPSLNGTHRGTTFADGQKPVLSMIDCLHNIRPEHLPEIEAEVNRLREEATELTRKADMMDKLRTLLAGTEPAPKVMPAGKAPARAPRPRAPKRATETAKRIAYYLATEGPRQFGTICQVLSVGTTAASENLKHPWFVKAEGLRGLYSLSPAGQEAMKEQFPDVEIRPQTA